MLSLVALGIGKDGGFKEGQAHHIVEDVVSILTIIQEAYAIGALG